MSVSNTAPSQEWIPLDPAAELYFVWERDGYPSTGWTAFSFRGSCDAASLQKALQTKLHLQPVFTSHLVVQTCGIRQTCFWKPTGEFCPLEVSDLRHLEKKPDDMDQWTQQTLAPYLQKYSHDLTSAFPIRFLLFLLPENSGLFVVAWHHSAMDGVGLYDFLREIFSEYHRLVTGCLPEWSSVAALHAQAGTVADIQPPRFGSVLKEACAQMIHYPVVRSAQLVSSSGTSSGRRMIRFVYDDPQVQKALRDRARRDGGTVSDLCLAAAKLALQEWNENHGRPPKIMHHMLAVNQRTRQAASRIANRPAQVAGILIPSGPEERKDPQTLLSHVIRYRRRLLDGGFDVAMQRLSNNTIRAGRILPVSVRYPVLRQLMDHRISFSLSNVGVVWPRIEKGRPTGQTAVYQIGHMEFLDVHTSLGNTRGNPLTMTMRTFRERLSLIFSVSLNRISEDDAQAFCKQIVNRMMNYL